VYDVFVISDDVVGEKMAGPGIRAWELSKCLARHFKVVLAIPEYSSASQNSTFFENIPFQVVRYSVDDPALIEKIGQESKIVLFQGYILSKFPSIKELPACMICDLYVPFPLENLFVHKWKVPSLKDREFIHQRDLGVFHDQIIHGDHFLCANARQRDLFVGSLLCLNRINPRYLDENPVLDELISIVPFGISPDPEESEKGNTLRNRVSGLDENSILLIWGGVLSNWFDPVTLIKAVHLAREKDPRIKLFFLSTKHPNPLLPEFDMAGKAVKVSGELGLTGTHVFFNPEWVDYDRRGAYFMEADIGVSIHKVHFETYYSFRTRILDYLKYDLPMICTEGDHLAEFIRGKGLGMSVRPEDEHELAAAILSLAGEKEWREKIKERIRSQKKKFYWERTCEPLIRYCRKALAAGRKKNKRPENGGTFIPALSGRPYSLKGWTKKRFWLLSQKLPLRLSAKIKRLFRF